MKKVTGALAAFFYSTSALWGATLLPNGEQQFIDANGKPYANGKIYFYSNFPTCTILKNTYKDVAGSVLNTNPVVLSAMGTATIFGVGAYCQVLKDQNGNTVWTKYTSDTSSASNLGWGGTSGGSANAQTVTVGTFTNTNGQSFYFVAGNTNTGAMTLSVNGGSPIAVTRASNTGVVALTGNEVTQGNVIGVTYVSSTGQFQLITSNVPSGYVSEIRTFASGYCPIGWLPADGSQVSASTYANLAATIGTTWGTASVGNVTLPDFRAAFLRGASNMSGPAGARTTMPNGASVVAQNIGSAGYVADTYLNHLHSIDPHQHIIDYATVSIASGSPGASSLYAPGTGPSQVNTRANTDALSTNNSTTGGTETQPRNYAVQYCIKY
jgi:microcystin-dependent protein